MHECTCGSGQDRRALYDARRIFAAYICDVCEREKRRRFRAEIFTDAGYDADEPIDGDEG